MKNQIKTSALVFLATMALTFITGCAPMISGAMNMSTDNTAVYDKTIKYFGAARKDIVISEIEKGMLSTDYKVKYAGKLYNCSIYYGEVDCKQPGESRR